MNFFLTNRNKCALKSVLIISTPKEFLKIKVDFQMEWKLYNENNSDKVADIDLCYMPGTVVSPLHVYMYLYQYLILIMGIKPHSNQCYSHPA